MKARRAEGRGGVLVLSMKFEELVLASERDARSMISMRCRPNLAYFFEV